MEIERRRLRHGSISATGILQPPSTAVGSVISCMNGRRVERRWKDGGGRRGWREWDKTDRFEAAKWSEKQWICYCSLNRQAVSIKPSPVPEDLWFFDFFLPVSVLKFQECYIFVLHIQVECMAFYSFFLSFLLFFFFFTKLKGKWANVFAKFKGHYASRKASRHHQIAGMGKLQASGHMRTVIFFIWPIVGV